MKMPVKKRHVYEGRGWVEARQLGVNVSELVVGILYVFGSRKFLPKKLVKAATGIIYYRHE